MRTVFFYGKNAGHVGGGHGFGCEIAVFEPLPQEIQVTFLSLRLIFRFPNHRVPLIDDKYNLRAGLSDELQNGVCQILAKGKLWVTFVDIFPDSLRDPQGDFRKGDILYAGIGKKTGNIKADDMVSVKVGFKALFPLPYFTVMAELLQRKSAHHRDR